MICNNIHIDYSFFNDNEFMPDGWQEMNGKNDKPKEKQAVIDHINWGTNSIILTGAYRSGRELKKQKKYKIGFKRKHPELFFDVAEAIVLR